MSPLGRPRVVVLLAGIVGILAGGTPAGAQEVRYSGSLGFSTGSYVFQDRTDSFYLVNGLSLSAERFSASVSLPVVAQSSRNVAFFGGGMMPTGGPGHEGPGGEHGQGGMGAGETAPETSDRAYETRIGDPLLRASYRVLQGTGILRALTVSGSAKVPVAPIASGIGTGAWDFGVGSSATGATGSLLLFGTLTLWSPGDMPELHLNEFAEISLGVGRALGTRWSLLSSLNAATRVIESIDPPASLSVSLGFRPTPGRTLSAGVSAGLTEASPDLSVRLGWGTGILGSADSEPESLPD